MKKIVLIALAVVVLLVLLAAVFRAPLKQFLYGAITDDMFVPADNDSFDPGPALGSRFPGLTALYQGERISLIEDFAGEKGTVLMADRKSVV